MVAFTSKLSSKVIETRIIPKRRGFVRILIETQVEMTFVSALELITTNRAPILPLKTRFTHYITFNTDPQREQIKRVHVFVSNHYTQGTINLKMNLS